jgi:septin family protein
MMEGISSLVAVVPVIAKADTHTAPELEAYRRELLQVGMHYLCSSTRVLQAR